MTNNKKAALYTIGIIVFIALATIVAVTSKVGFIIVMSILALVMGFCLIVFLFVIIKDGLDEKEERKARRKMLENLKSK